MFGLGGLELVIILVLVMLMFGVGRLPAVGAALGRGMRELKSGITGRDEVILATQEIEVRTRK